MYKLTLCFQSQGVNLNSRGQHGKRLCPNCPACQVIFFSLGNLYKKKKTYLAKNNLVNTFYCTVIHLTYFSISDQLKSNEDILHAKRSLTRFIISPIYKLFYSRPMPGEHSTPWILNSRYWILDSLSVKCGFRITIYSRIRIA